jgi:hypothetical protein
MSGFPYFSSTYCKSQEIQMLWLLLFAFVALAIFINSFRLLLLALIALLIYMGVKEYDQ